MSITKHKIITVPILDESATSFQESALKEIDHFLADPNIVYEGHSICIATTSYREYGSTLTKNEALLISIIYKDLSGSTVDLKSASPKVRKIVQKSVSKGEVLPEPEILSEFERKLKSDQGGT